MGNATSAAQAEEEQERAAAAAAAAAAREAAEREKRRRRGSWHKIGANLTDFYRLGKILGKNAISEIRAGARRVDGRRVAIRIFSKGKMSEEDKVKMMAECETMRRVRGHPNVIHFIEAFDEAATFSVVCDLYTGGEVMERVIAAENFSEKDASRYFKQMAGAVKHLHDKQVCHRDIKAENFLFKSQDDDTEIRLIDFSQSCRTNVNHLPGSTNHTLAAPGATAELIMTDALGSAYYIAPEVFRRKYTKAVDAWALGVVLYLLLSGEVPFGHEASTEAEVYRAIQESPLKFGPVWNDVTSAARELVQGLLDKDPARRYTVEQALSHPWVDNAGIAAVAPLNTSLFNSLLSYSNKNKLRKKAVKFVAGKLSAHDVRHLREAFCKIDADNTGFITYAELKEALQEAGWTGATEEEVNAMLKEMDEDGDGTISWEEFLEATAERQMIQYQQTIWETFCELDNDGSGEISVEELKKIMKDETAETIQQYVDEYDADGNGLINFEEFLRMLLPRELKFKLAPPDEEALAPIPEDEPVVPAPAAVAAGAGGRATSRP